MHSSNSLIPSGRFILAGWRGEVFAMVMLLGVVYISALPGMSAPPLLDDRDQLDFVSHFKSLADCFGKDAFGLFRPLKNIIYYVLSDVGIRNWHLFNISIFLTAVIAVHVLLRRILQSAAWAFLATAFWATCPTQVSAALWLTCVNICLAVVFICACLYFHDRSRSDGRRNIGLVSGAILFMFLAEFSYESAVSLPALCLLVDHLRRRPLLSRDAMVRYSVYGIVTLIYLVIRSHAGAISDNQFRNLSFPPDLEKWQLSVSAPWFLWKNFSMWLMPLGRIEFLGSYIWGVSASWIELVLAWGWLLGIVVCVVLMRKREPLISFGLLWFLCASFPSSNFVPISAGPIADYYLIIPSIGLAVALIGFSRQIIAWLSSSLNASAFRLKYARIATFGILITWRALGVPLFWLQASLWNHPLELYLNGALARPGQYQNLSHLASGLVDVGAFDQAEEYAVQAYELAPWHPDGTRTLARINFLQAKYDKSIAYYDESLRLNLGNSFYQDFCYLHKAEALMARPETRSMTRDCLLPILSNTNSKYHLEAVNLLVDYYVSANKMPEAINALTNGIKIHPQDTLLVKRLEEINSKLREQNSQAR